MSDASNTPVTHEVADARRRRGSWTYRPQVDIFETPEAILLIADVPGADPGAIDVSLESGVLTLQAAVEPRTHGAAESLAHEYGVGGFHRRFEIDESIDTEAVSASYRDGSLTLRLPKTPRVRRRRIPISA